MKRYVILLCVSLFSLSVFAQKVSIVGTVVDESNQALIGASVTIANTYIGSYTNAKGEFDLKNISLGSYTIIVSYIGYKTVEKSIELKDDMQLSISLLPNTYAIQPVTVTAIKAKEYTPVAQSNLKKAEISQLNVVKDIPYQLETTPSVVATSENGTGMGYTNMRIRGTDMSRINVTINGIPLNDAESQGVFWVNMADFGASVEDVQIQRGVGTSTNGAASFGASVNFQTATPEAKKYARVSQTVGSFGTFKENVSLGSGIIDSCFALSVRYSKLNSEGWVQRGFSDHQSFHGNATYFDKKNTLTAQVFLGQEKTGITWWGLPSDMLSIDKTYNPSGKYVDDNGIVQYNENETDNYWQNHYFLTYNRTVSKYITFTTSLHATTGKGYYEEYKSRLDDWGSENTFAKYGMQNIAIADTVATFNNFQFVFPDSTITSSDMIRQKWLHNIFYGFNASVNYSKNKVEASIGTAYNIYEGNHNGLINWVKFMPDMTKDFEWYNNDGTKKDGNIFVKIQYHLSSKVSVYGDVQYRSINYTLQGLDDDLYQLDQKYSWNFVNPKAGVFYKINQKNSVFASIAVANREPTRNDLKDAFKDNSTPAPKHETLKDLELGYSLKFQKIGIGVNLYHMQYDNQLVLTGKLNDVGYPIMTNVKDSYRRGVELSIGYRPAQKIEWNANITVSQNKIDNYVEYSTHYDTDWNSSTEPIEMGTTDISYSPNVIASNTITFYPSKTMNFGFTSKFVGKQYFDNTSDNTRSIDSYMVHNFQIQYSIPFEKSKKLSLQLIVNNLLDVDYINNAYGGNWYEQGTEQSWMYYFPQAGLNAMSKITFDF